MNEEEKKDILFEIDMQLYNEFNDKLAEMNDHLGDIYSLRDVEEVEKAEKDKEIILLREAVKKQQKELDKEKEKNKELTEYLITQNYEINRLNLAKIRLEMSQLPDTAEGYKYLKNEYKMRLSRMNLEDYKRNYISKDKIKEKIEPVLKQLERKMEEEYNKYGNSREYQDVVDAYNFLQSLLEKE